MCLYLFVIGDMFKLNVATVYISNEQVETDLWRRRWPSKLKQHSYTTSHFVWLQRKQISFKFASQIEELSPKWDKAWACD